MCKLCPTLYLVDKKASEYDQEIPQSHTTDHFTAQRGRAQNNNNRSQDAQKTNIVKQPASLFPIKLIAKLERGQSNA